MGESRPGETTLVERAMALIDVANGADPTKTDGVAKELLYAHRMSAALSSLSPGASEVLRLAVRAQHLERWKIARDTYPRDRVGYLRWRADLARMHAERAGEILREAGYDEATVERVQSLVQKRRIKSDDEAQTVEDCACLVFLEHHLEELRADQGDEKMIDILRKTWAKMSERGRAHALSLPISDSSRALVVAAISPGGERP